MLTSWMLSLAFGAAGALAQSTAAAAPTDLASELELQSTAKGRIGLLQDSDFVFDFFNPPTGGVVPGAGGHLVLAAVADFPALVKQDVAIAVGFLGPCGLNVPHTHPRAAEFLYLVNGTLVSGMITETGSRFIAENITAGQGTILPKGSIHFQFNDNCEPVHFVSALSSEDPGTLLVPGALFGLPPDIVAASLGQIGVEEVAGLANMIPDDVALGSASCLQRCSIQATAQPTAQQIARTSGNALPAASASATLQSRKWQSTSAHVADALAGSGSSSSTTQPVTIALIVVVGVMGAGYLVLGGLFLMSRWRGKSVKGRTFIRPDMAGESMLPTLEKYDVVESHPTT